jgi:hypothetical protein
MRPILLALLAAAAPAAADVSPFRTPSGNIACTIWTGEGPPDLACAIFERAGPLAAPQPADCPGPWGHRFVLLATGPVRMECGGPGPRNDSPGVDVAGYGVSADWGGISCASSREGLDCRNADGHGFFLSRARQSVF